MASSDEFSFDSGSRSISPHWRSNGNYNPFLKPIPSEILSPNSVVLFKQVVDANGWYEMKTIDGDGNIMFHYGKRKQKRGTTSLKRLTFQELKQLKDSDVLGYSVFILLQHTFFVDSRFCNSWYNPEKDLKWHEFGRSVRPMGDMQPAQWFETITNDESGIRYHYSRPGDSKGTTSSRPLIIRELELLDVCDMPEFDLFICMQGYFLGNLPSIRHWGNFICDSRYHDAQVSMIQGILDRIRINSGLEQLRVNSQPCYLRTVYEQECIRISSALSRFTTALKQGIIDPVDIASDRTRIISELDYLQKTFSVTFPNLALLLEKFSAEMRLGERKRKREH